MRTLRDLVDEEYAGGRTIVVMSPSGERLGEVRPGEEGDAFALARHMGSPVLRETEADGSLYAYVGTPSPDSAFGPKAPSVYPGEIPDEAAWSADWRSRERKVSPKQLAFIRKNLALYRAVRSPSWPEDPSALLAHEASDAMDVMIGIIKGAR